MYLYDIAILSKAPKQHTNHVRRVLSLLNCAGAALRLKKCSFFTNTVDYLGYKTSPRRLDLVFPATSAVRRLKLPTSTTEPRSYLRLHNVFAQFVFSTARIAASLKKGLYYKTERKCLAKVWSATLLHSYLERNRLLTHTGLEAFNCILNFMDPTGRLDQWCRRFSAYSFNDVHRAGINQQIADPLSHLNTFGQGRRPQEDELPIYEIDNLYNSHESVHSTAHNEKHAQKLSNTNPSVDKTEYASPTTVIRIQVQKEVNFSHTKAAQVEQRSCEL